MTRGVAWRRVGDDGADEGRMDEAVASRFEVVPAGVLGKVRGYELDEQAAQKT